MDHHVNILVDGHETNHYSKMVRCGVRLRVCSVSRQDEWVVEDEVISTQNLIQMAAM